VIKMNENKPRVLTSRKNALEEYIGALITEYPVPEAASTGPTVFKQDEKVSQLLPTGKESQQEKRPEQTAKPDIETKKDNLIDVRVFHVSGLRVGLPDDRIDEVINCPVDAMLATELLVTVPELVADNQPVTIINTLELMSLQDTGQEKHKIALFNDRKCGLFFDDVGELMALDRDDVRWSTTQTKRKWLAGTVVKHQMALLDMDQLITIING